MNVDILFLNNKAMEAVGVNDMNAAIQDVERAYVLNQTEDVINPGKCVLRWGKTVEDENVMGRINAMPGYVGGEYDMAGIKWIGSGPMNYKKGLPRASVTIILNDPDTKLPVCVADGTAISATAVRKLVADGHWEEIRSLVPQATYDYFSREDKREEFFARVGK